MIINIFSTDINAKRHFLFFFPDDDYHGTLCLTGPQEHELLNLECPDGVIRITRLYWSRYLQTSRTCDWETMCPCDKTALDCQHLDNSSFTKDLKARCNGLRMCSGSYDINGRIWTFTSEQCQQITQDTADAHAVSIGYQCISIEGQLPMISIVKNNPV